VRLEETLLSATEKSSPAAKPSTADKLQKKPYIYAHRHCKFCGRTIEVKGREYCLKCKPEYQKEQSKIDKSRKYQKYLIYYVIAVAIIFAAVIIYSLI
jgi:predicted nucleic acid-binding Zn ribbon protein